MLNQIMYSVYYFSKFACSVQETDNEKNTRKILLKNILCKNECFINYRKEDTERNYSN